MVAEVDPLEASENRKSNDKIVTRDDSTETLRSCNTASSTQSKPKLQPGTIVDMNDTKDRQESSIPSISLDFQPPMSPFVKAAPRAVTIIPASMAGTGSTSNDLMKKQNEGKTSSGIVNQTQTIPSTMKRIVSTMKSQASTSASSKAVIDSSHPTSNHVATATVTATATIGSSGGDRDTVNKPNFSLLSSQLMSKAMIDRGLVANTDAQRQRSISISSAKRVSFTATTHAQQLPNKAIAQHQATTIAKNTPPRPAPVSTAVPKPKAPSLSLLGSPNNPSVVSTALKPPPFHDMTPKPVSVIDDALQKARLPLVAPYGPFIHPLDTTLAGARKRLRTALDQTRALRAAFSERVYDKYRVILKPVPDHVDKIVDKITTDPIGMNKKLIDEVRLVKDEKELERKEAQKLAATGIFNGTGADGKHPAVSASASETADQLAYVGAGLNLVILPEEDVKDSGIDTGKYKFRGPTNPETGQRVGGISAAASTAAEVLLDRVRRATIMRSGRKLRQQTGAKSDIPVDDSVSSSILSRYHMLAAAAVTPAVVKLVARPIPTYVPPPVKQTKRAAKVSSSSAVSKKSVRSRNQQPLVPIGSILSLNPLVEDSNPDRRPSASTSALLSRNVGSKHQPQQWQHPHPDSLGGRKSSLSSNSKRGDFRGMDAARMGKIGLDLPLLPTASDRREKRPLPVHDRTQVTSIRAKDALQSILSKFVPRGENTQANKQFDQAQNHDMNKTSADDTKTHIMSRKRRATEIGLMHGMQHATAGKPVTNVATVTGEVPGVQSSVPATLRVPCDQSAIEPIVAFSVLQALGLIHDTPSSQREQSPQVLQRLTRVSPTAESSPRSLASPRFLALYGKVTAKKRSFTEAFASDFLVSAGNQAVQPPPARSPRTTNIPNAAVIAPTKKPTPKGNGHNGQPTISVMTMQKEENAAEECAVVSIRGGGTDEDAAAAYSAQQGGNALPHGQAGGASANDYFIDHNDRMRRPMSAPSSRPGSSSSASVGFSQNRPSSSDGLYSVLAQNRTVASFSPQRNAGFALATGNIAHRGVADRVQAQAHQLQLQAVAMNRMSQSPGGNLAEFFGAGLHQRQQGFAGHTDWGALNAQQRAAMNLVPSHSSLAAIGMNPHQAAMLELSARDRAARALLVREQQAAVHAAAVHRHASAAAMRGSAGVAGLSSHQAAALMNAQAAQSSHQAAALMNAQANQAGAGLFSASAASRYGQIGAHSAATTAAIMSSPAAVALMGQSQMGSGSMPGHIALGQHSNSRPSSRPCSRPSSQHSTSSTKPNKAKRVPSRPSSSKGRKVAKEETIIADVADAAITMALEMPIPDPNENNATKRKAPEITPPVEEKEIETATSANKSVTASIAGPEETKTRPPSRERSPPRKKTAPSTAGDVEKSFAAVPQIAAPIGEKLTAPTKPVPTPSVIMGAQEAKPPSFIEDSGSPQLPSTAGMQFFVPPVPPVLNPQMATCVLDGRIHVAMSKLFLSSGELRSVTNASALLDYLHAVGCAVPIPKALISNHLKERLNLQSFKTAGNGGHMPSVPRDVVVGIILVWLWVQHKDSFQRAFAKSGRIDVDPECKWLIQAAVDAGSRALMTELSEALQHGGPLAAAMASARIKGGSGSAKASGSDLEKQAAASITVDTRVALIVSEALMTELCIDEEVDAVIPIYEDLVQLLDEARMNALKAKCRERVLLAALVSQRATMSEAFAHAYVSSLVRAGEALGHGDLFELVQDEGTSTSTMIPYDIFSDESGAWEDPCRPAMGYTASLTGEDLVRRAHARGMILKSLKRMQDRSTIKGGTPDSGPYTERSQGQSTAGASERAHQRTSGGSIRRKPSFSLSDHHVQPGTGSSRATSINQYNPQHVSTPLFWDGMSIDNLPYGKHAHLSRPRALSISALVAGKEDTKDGRKRGRASSIAPSQPVVVEVPLDGCILRSTEAVNWADVAKVFQSVNLESGRKRSSKSHPPAHHQPRAPLGRTIFAPFCNRINEEEIVGGESESEEEDLSDAASMERHNIVLAQMKEKLDTFMEGRTTAGQRARQRAQARAAEKTAFGE